MKRIQWTNEMLKEEALKYTNVVEFKKSSSAWQAAYKRGIDKEICAHMTGDYIQWTDEMIQQEALKYKTRGEFISKNMKAYRAAERKGTLDQVCSHMSRVYESWNFEKVLAEASKFKTRADFAKYSPQAFQASRNNKWYEKVCAHMDLMIRPWSIEEVVKEALKYSNRMSFANGNNKAYMAATRMDILDQVCSHMVTGTNASGSEKNLFEEIQKLYPKTQKLVDRQALIHGKPYIKGFDIDIYVPELRKGIEFDGIYYHSVDGLKRGRPKWPQEDLENYHQIKDEYFKSKGIELLHINEKDWLKEPDKCIEKCMEFLKIK